MSKNLFGRFFKKGKAARPTAPEGACEEDQNLSQALPADQPISAASETQPVNDPLDDVPQAESSPGDISQAAPDGVPLSESQTNTPVLPDPAARPSKRTLLSRLTSGLSRTSNKISDGVTSIFTKRKLDTETLEELEDLLISADLGVTSAAKVTAALAKDKFDKEISGDAVRQALAQVVADDLKGCEAPLMLTTRSKPHVILMTGVNGAGKTTTIGKLAAQYQARGLRTMLVAGDTFRAAAIEQLVVWGDRTRSKVVTRDQGADAAGLVFDALKEAKQDAYDVVLIDTAGRLQNRQELMDELGKIVRVVKKIDPSLPNDVVLVLDATVGQNAISQTTAFQEIAGVTGLIMTKLDGTARGGVLVALAEKFNLPIHYIGVGEGIDDLQPFSALDFANALAGVPNNRNEQA